MVLLRTSDKIRKTGLNECLDTSTKLIEAKIFKGYSQHIAECIHCANIFLLHYEMKRKKT